MIVEAAERSALEDRRRLRCSLRDLILTPVRGDKGGVPIDKLHGREPPVGFCG